MEQAFDSLGAYRRLEESGMPEGQANATVEVVRDAMQNLVTKEYFTVELDRRFGKVDGRFGSVDERFGKVYERFSKVDSEFVKLRSDMDERFSKIDGEFVKLRSDMDERFSKLEAKLDTSVAELGKSQARGLLTMSIFMIALVSMLIAVLRYPDARADTGPINSAEPTPAVEAEATESTHPSPAQLP